MSTVAFDIGGTNIRVAALTEDGIGEVLREKTPVSPDAALTLVAQLIEKLVPSDLSGVVGGIPGKIGPEGTIVVSPNLPTWNGYAFGERLGHTLSVPVKILNDAALAGLGEGVYGAGKGFRTVMYVGLGTGVGMSRVVDGVLDEYADTEAGHQVIDTESGATLESFIGGRSLSQKYGITPEEIPALVWQELATVLATGIQKQSAEWKPDVVVLGGSLMNETSGFRLEDVRTALASQSGATVFPELRKSLLGDTCALWGAKTLKVL